MASIMGLQQPAASQDTVDYTGYLQSSQCHQVHGSQANGQIQSAQKSPSNDHNTSFTSTKGLLNGPGQNNCFLNSAVQNSNTILASHALCECNLSVNVLTSNRSEDRSLVFGQQIPEIILQATCSPGDEGNAVSRNKRRPGHPSGGTWPIRT
ncbi:hypothetical protein WN48_10366 [Eufriesea mexicana]|nr:hypothetical protein WN48_10366 [Eufriesea mexicana]